MVPPLPAPNPSAACLCGVILLLCRFWCDCGLPLMLLWLSLALVWSTFGRLWPAPCVVVSNRRTAQFVAGFTASGSHLPSIAWSSRIVELLNLWLASQLQVGFDRHAAIRISGLSEKAYIRSLTNLQNALGLRLNVDVRELAIQFGCVRLIASVQRVLVQYKQRFVASLPETRKGSADFSRAVFTAVAFYLCAKRNKLKVDKLRLIEICGTSESEFTTVSSSMLDLCFDLVGLERERKESNSMKCKKDSSKRKKVEPRSSVSELDSADEDLSEISQLLKRSRSSCDV